MVPYIDDSHVGRWKKLPRDRHVRRVSYHPSLRSNLSSLCLELTHQQFNSLQYHESSFSERYCKLLQLVYCGSKPRQQSPSKQRPPRSSYHPPRIAEVNNNRVHTCLLKSLCRVLVVKSYQEPNPAFSTLAFAARMNSGLISYVNTWPSGAIPLAKADVRAPLPVPTSNTLSPFPIPSWKSAYPISFEYKIWVGRSNDSTISRARGLNTARFWPILVRIDPPYSLPTSSASSK